MRLCRQRRERVRPFGLERLGRACLRRPGRAAAVGGAVLAAALPGIFTLRVQDSWVDNFDPDAEIVLAEEAFNASFWGSYRYDVVFEAPEPFLRPSFMQG